MKHLTYGYAVVFAVGLFGFADAELNGKEHSSRKLGAVPGFYIQIETCHACAYPDWQREAGEALATSGVAAFASDDIVSRYSDQPFDVVKALPLRKIGDEGWPIPIYAGPFNTEREARQLLVKLPTILQAGIAKTLKATGEQQAVARGLENCSGNHCNLSGYSLNLVRVPP
jgi:hypothetical protein